MKKTLFIITISLSLSSCLDHLLDPDKPETSQEVINQDGSKQNREDNEQSAPGNSSVSTKNNNSRLEDRTNTEKQNQTEAIQKTVYTDSHNSTKKDTPLYRFTSERLTSVEELSKYSISDLKIMRNEVFARHGYIFIEGSEMHTYFNQMNWYTERRKNVDDYIRNKFKL